MTFLSQLYFVLGAVCLLSFIVWLLKKGTLCIKYSILWLACGVVLLIFAAVPYLVFVIRDLLDMVMPSNVVFLLLFVFVLSLLLSLSIGISELAEKSKRQTQSIALLELRVRALEAQQNDAKTTQGAQSVQEATPNAETTATDVQNTEE